MDFPIHLTILSRIPDYTEGRKKLCKTNIQLFLKEQGYDKDFYESIDDNFCQGFAAARDSIIEILKQKYWQEHNEKEEQQNA